MLLKCILVLVFLLLAVVVFVVVRRLELINHVMSCMLYNNRKN